MVGLKPGSHLCDKHNISDISISISMNMFLFSCAYAYAYVACVMLIAQVGTRLKCKHKRKILNQSASTLRLWSLCEPCVH